MSISIIRAANVNYALEESLWKLRTVGVVSDSRNGRVLRAPGPVVTETFHPTQRVLFSSLRDANPFFHLLESMWMLAGRNDTASLTPYVARMQDFSDDGTTLNGAYGYRWRNHFGYDQLEEIVAELKANPSSRRCVLQMWDGGQPQLVGYPDDEGYGLPDSDLLKAKAGSKDVPCNTNVYFDALDGQLNMTVCCRSNDAIWGAHGANAVHFSILQEYVAAAVGLKVGTMYQLSNNYHIYLDRPDVKRLYDHDTTDVVYVPVDMYNLRGVRTAPLLRPGELPEALLADCEGFFAHGGSDGFTPISQFFAKVFLPMMKLHRLHKARMINTPQDVAQAIGDSGMDPSLDWHYAAIDWVERRRAALP